MIDQLISWCLKQLVEDVDRIEWIFITLLLLKQRPFIYFLFVISVFDCLFVGLSPQISLFLWDREYNYTSYFKIHKSLAFGTQLKSTNRTKEINKK